MTFWKWLHWAPHRVFCLNNSRGLLLQLFPSQMEPVLKIYTLKTCFVHSLWLKMVTCKRQLLIIVHWGGLLTAARTQSACNNSDDRSTADPCSWKTILMIQCTVGELNYHRFFDTCRSIVWQWLCYPPKIVNKPKKQFSEPIIISLSQPDWTTFPLKTVLIKCWLNKTKDKKNKKQPAGSEME